MTSKEQKEIKKEKYQENKKKKKVINIADSAIRYVVGKEIS